MAGNTTVDFIVEMGLGASRYLAPPNRQQHTGIQHDVVTVSPFVGAVHGSLVPVALHRADVGEFSECYFPLSHRTDSPFFPRTTLGQKAPGERL